MHMCTSGWRGRRGNYSSYAWEREWHVECQGKRGKRRAETRSGRSHARGSKLICVWMYGGLDLVTGKDISDSKLI
jgi:hypothetical protein